MSKRTLVIVIKLAFDANWAVLVFCSSYEDFIEGKILFAIFKEYGLKLLYEGSAQLLL